MYGLLRNLCKRPSSKMHMPVAPMPLYGLTNAPSSRQAPMAPCARYVLYDYTDHSILGHHCHHPHRCVALSGQIRSITSNDIFLLTPALGGRLVSMYPTSNHIIVKKASYIESEVCGVGRQKRRPCLARTGRQNVSTIARATGSGPKNPTSYFDACCI